MGIPCNYETTNKETQEMIELAKFNKEFNAYWQARKNNYMIKARREGQTLSQIAKATGMLETNVSRALKDKHKEVPIPDRPEYPFVPGPALSAEEEYSDLFA